VYEYIKNFNYLAQYGTHHVDTNDKKAELFKRGLSLPLQDRLVWLHGVSFNALVSAAIEQEGTYIALLPKEEKMRKRASLRPLEDTTGDAPPKYRLVYTPSVGKSRVPPPPPHWDHHPPQHQMLLQSPVQTQQPILPRATQQETTVVKATCFNCGRVGHFV
jgi:hypothetical protein